jgi:hypothetical protein
LEFSISDFHIIIITIRRFNTGRFRLDRVCTKHLVYTNIHMANGPYLPQGPKSRLNCPTIFLATKRWKSQFEFVNTLGIGNRFLGRSSNQSPLPIFLLINLSGSMSDLVPYNKYVLMNINKTKISLKEHRFLVKIFTKLKKHRALTF